MDNGRRLTIYVMAWPSIAWALAGLAITASALLMPDLDLGERLPSSAGGLAIASISTFVVVKRSAVLRVGDNIVYRRLFVHVEVPLDRARRVCVERKLLLYTPVFWDLVIDVAGTERRLPIAAHYWFGGHLQRRADRIAERLRIPVVDPVGDEWRAHRFWPMRLLGRGHEWLLVVGPAALIVAAALLIAI